MSAVWAYGNINTTFVRFLFVPGEGDRRSRLLVRFKEVQLLNALNGMDVEAVLQSHSHIFNFISISSQEVNETVWNIDSFTVGLSAWGDLWTSCQQRWTISAAAVFQKCSFTQCTVCWHLAIFTHSRQLTRHLPPTLTKHYDQYTQHLHCLHVFIRRLFCKSVTNISALSSSADWKPRRRSGERPSKVSIRYGGSSMRRLT